MREVSNRLTCAMVGGGGSAILAERSHSATRPPHIGGILTMLARNSLVRSAMTVGALLLAVGVVRAADVPTDPAARTKVIGTPKSIAVQPDKITLSGPRATSQPVVTGVYADGSVRDLTQFADFKIEGAD